MIDPISAPMLRALELAELGRGHVEPNPLVGAVLAHHDRIVGEGYHKRFGDSHAEVNAIQAAGPNAAGATLFVTLEPCCHHGKTPPCTDAILNAQVARVVVATLDPFPRVAGRGVQILRDAGIDVQVGLLQDQARKLNAPFFKRIQTGLPYVHAKWAMSLDGRIATATGDSKWITGQAAREHAHRFRGLMDAILVGVETVLADDPLLTARPPGPRTATRIVLDSTARTSIQAQIVQTAGKVPTMIATTHRANPDQINALSNAGCEILTIPTDTTNRVSILNLLKILGDRQWTNILIEGGAHTLAAFLDSGQIDAVRAYIAPCIIGGQNAKPPLAGRGFQQISQILRLEPEPPLQLGPDLFLQAQQSMPS